LGRKFQIIDDNNNGNLEFAEFKKACKELTLDWPESDIREVFNYFDKNGNGELDYDEFLVGIRGKLNERRTQLVLLAFDVLDRDKSGIIEINDIVNIYDASKHPDVISGKKTKAQVFREFLDNFDVIDKDGKVTPAEFCKYYSNISASIDEDDYFELMIRNAWHISGGEGQFANTTCRRVLVNHTDGRQTVEEIKDDFGMDTYDIAAMKANLEAQGMSVKSIDLNGTTGETPLDNKKEAPFEKKRPEIKVTTQPQKKSITQPEIKTTTQPEIKARIQPEIKTATQPEIRARTQPEIKTATQPEIRARTQPEIKTATQPEIRARTQPEIKTATQPEIKAKTQPEIKIATQPEIKIATQPEKKNNVQVERRGRAMKSTPLW
jgi:Ca2+-binding EF-hand superfamily protein